MINELGFDVCKSIEEFFQKVKDWKDEDKPSETTIKTAQKIVEKIKDTPIMLSVFEKSINIDYDEMFLEITDYNIFYGPWRDKNEQ